MLSTTSDSSCLSDDGYSEGKRARKTEVAATGAIADSAPPWSNESGQADWEKVGRAESPSLVPGQG